MKRSNLCVMCGCEAKMVEEKNVDSLQTFVWECMSCGAMAFVDGTGLYYDVSNCVHSPLVFPDLIEVPNGCLFVFTDLTGRKKCDDNRMPDMQTRE